MHRRSAFENPIAPLGHHTFDSTHIVMGVFSAALERGPWQVEGSVFHGAEPDEQRWDLMDPGPLDSWSARGWFRPSDAWAFQLSYGFLSEPEALEEGDVRRTTASASWTRLRPGGWDAATVAYGRNVKLESTFDAVLAESTHVIGRTALYTRAEVLQVETNLLRFGVHEFGGGRKAHVPDDVGGRDWVTTGTLGALRTLARFAGWDLAAGGDVTAYRVPSILAPLYGNRPVSFHLFVRVRPPAMIADGGHDHDAEHALTPGWWMLESGAGGLGISIRHSAVRISSRPTIRETASGQRSARRRRIRRARPRTPGPVRA